MTRNASVVSAAEDVPGWPDWADPAAVDRLRAIIRSNSTGHAYLLAGPKGTGKACLARTFAQAVCCTAVAREDPSDPCGICRACRNVQRGAHPDVEVFDLATQASLADKPGRGANLSIDSMRRLRASAALLPLESARRVLIVDDAETLLEPAQQALLKLLEEPPRFVTILLLVDEPETLLATVRSRCQQIAVRPVPEVAILNALVARGVDGNNAAEIAALSRGCAAWAVAAAADGALLSARRTERDAAADWITAAQYARLVTAYTLGEQFAKRRGEVISIVQAAVQIFRERMIHAAGAVEQAADGPTPPVYALSAAVAASLQCLSDLEANVRPKLALEAMVLAWPNLETPRA
jgi:DNA polymerase-3 subunit delta'